MNPAALSFWHMTFSILTVASLVLALVGGVGTFITDRLLKRLDQERAATTARQLDQAMPRQLTSAQRTTIVRHLSPHAGSKVEVTSAMGDPEAAAYAQQFVECFNVAGWEVEATQTLWAGNPGGLFVFRSAAVADMADAPRSLMALLTALVDSKTPMSPTVEVHAHLDAERFILAIGPRHGHSQIVGQTP